MLFLWLGFMIRILSIQSFNHYLIHLPIPMVKFFPAYCCPTHSMFHVVSKITDVVKVIKAENTFAVSFWIYKFTFVKLFWRAISDMTWAVHQVVFPVSLVDLGCWVGVVFPPGTVSIFKTGDEIAIVLFFRW